MSFRVEDKYIVNNEDRIKILSFIKKDGFEPAYNNRNITSIYFDNKNLSNITLSYYIFFDKFNFFRSIILMFN